MCVVVVVVVVEESDGDGLEHFSGWQDGSVEKVLVAKSDDLSLIFRTHKVNSYSALLISMHTKCTHAHTHTPYTKFIYIPSHEYHVLSAQESPEYSHWPSEVNTHPVNTHTGHQK